MENQTPPVVPEPNLVAQTINPTPESKPKSKKLFIIIGIVLFLLIAGGAAAGFVYKDKIINMVSKKPTSKPTTEISPVPTIPAVDETIKGWKTYSGEGYEIQYPNALVSTDHPKSETINSHVTFASKVDDPDRITVEKDTLGSTTYSKIISMDIGETLETITDILVYKRGEDINVGTGLAKAMSYDFEVIIPEAAMQMAPSNAKVLPSKLVPGKKIANHGKSFIIVSNGQIYSIGITLGVSENAQLEEQFKSMVDTFKLTE